MMLRNTSRKSTKFTRDAVGESTMHEYQREGQPWRTYVDVRIEGEVLPVGPAGGNKGIYLKTPWDDSLEKLASDNQECCNILSFCEKKKIRVTEVLHSELHKFK